MIMLHVLLLPPLLSAASAHDGRRVNGPQVPFALEPLQWGQVTASGWIKDWALAARHGAGSPEHAAFANVKATSYPPFTIPPDCATSVDGWKDGRPCNIAFWDEDSAYWVDGMTRLGAVLNDSTLQRRVREDFAYVLAHPDNFNATWHRPLQDLDHSEAEGWVRSIYSRAMLAYYDWTGDAAILDFLVTQLSSYTVGDSGGGRSLTQIEALLESHAYGGPASLVDTAIGMMETEASSLRYLDALLSPNCTNATAIAQDGACLNHEHGVTFNELAKLFAMISSWNSNQTFLQASVNAYDMVERFNVQVHGVVSAHESLGGIGPNVGTETCDVSDFMYS
jgi:hypothetical protein